MGNILRCVKDDDDGTSYRPSLDDTPRLENPRYNRAMYNTYVIDDLPPTPIAIPSKTSLIAASQPSETNFLFFVSKGDGSHYFSVTYNEHLSAISEYQ